MQLPPIPTILPAPFEWIAIPAGNVTIREEFSQKSYIPKDTSHKFSVEPFIIAKYPITQTQYAVFSEENYPAGQGEHPIVDVSMWEVLKFCGWLSEQTGLVITLPTEAQWQHAAQGNSDWSYPWGNKFDKKKCNSEEARIKTATPVTRFARGASPYGVMDMSGNVWEWSLTDFATGANEMNYDNDNYRVLRGGSWLNNKDGVRVISRDGDHPGSRNVMLGFRVCIAVSE